MHVRSMLRAALPVAIILLVPMASAATATVDLRTADPFAILAGSGITNTGVTTVTGDVGSHPTADQSGFGPGANAIVLTGTNHHDDAVTSAAKDDLVTAYNDAAGRPVGTLVVGGELGGLTLTPGVYVDDNAPDSLAITGTLTLNGMDDPDSVFIFQSGSTLITASSSNVILTRGAQACHVFWQVGSSATLGTGSHLEGTILALASITFDHAATLDGRALARNGAVTLDANTLQVVPCDSQPPPTTSPPSTSSTTPPTSAPPTSPPPTSGPPASTPPTSPPDTSPLPTSVPPTSPAPTTPPLPSTTPPETTPAGTTPPPTSLPPAVPFFPTTSAIVLALVVGAGGVLFVMRKKLR